MKYIFFIVLFISGCSKRKVPRTNTLNFPLKEEVSTLDPAQAFDVVSSAVVYQSLETLYEYEYLKRPYSVRPLLADGMPLVSEDGKTVKIKIKKGIFYHDNSCFGGKKREVKAADFITAVKRTAFIPTKSKGWWLFDKKIEGINQYRKKIGNKLNNLSKNEISGFRALDDQTIEIKLIKPYPQLIYSLAMTFTSPIPIEILSCYENNLSEVLVGTGPFVLKKWTRGLELIFEKNKNYGHSLFPTQGDRYAHDNNLLSDQGKKLPFVDGIKFKIIKEASTRWLQFLSGKLDLYPEISKEHIVSSVDDDGKLKEEYQKKSIELIKSPTLIYWWIAFNQKDSLVGKNKNLRMAIAHGVDFKKFIKLFTNNVGQRANSIFPPGIPGYSPLQKLPYTYDLKKAKSFLAKAGFPGGKGLPTLVYDTRKATPQSRQEAIFLKAELEKIGIKMDIQINSFPAFLKKAYAGKLQFWKGGWALDYPDAENVIQLLYSGNHSPGPNFQNYKNKEIDALIKKINILDNSDEKYKLLSELEYKVNEDFPWIMNFYQRDYNLTYSYLKNYRASSLIFNGLKYIRLSQ